MSITANVTRIDNGSNVRGLATIEIDEVISINSIKVIEGEKGLFVSMPKYKDNNGQYKDLVFPIKEGLYSLISDTVLESYLTGEKIVLETEPKEHKFKADLSLNKQDNNLKAGGRITLNDEIVITHVKLLESKKGDLFISLPSYQDKNGEWQSIVYPKSKEISALMKEAAVKKYNDLKNNIILTGEVFVSLNTRQHKKI